MSDVVHGKCPDCGQSTDGDPRGPRLGALCFSLQDHTGGERVVPCQCGSKKRPVPA